MKSTGVRSVVYRKDCKLESVLRMDKSHTYREHKTESLKATEKNKMINTMSCGTLSHYKNIRDREGMVRQRRVGRKLFRSMEGSMFSKSLLYVKW